MRPPAGPPEGAVRALPGEAPLSEKNGIFRLTLLVREPSEKKIIAKKLSRPLDYR